MKRFWRNEEDAFHLSHYFEFISGLESNHSAKEIEARTRDSIAGVHFCDVTRWRPTGGIFNDDDSEIAQKADVIITSLVFDVVAVDQKAFAAVLANVRYVHQSLPTPVVVMFVELSGAI